MHFGLNYAILNKNDFHLGWQGFPLGRQSYRSIRRKIMTLTLAAFKAKNILIDTEQFLKYLACPVSPIILVNKIINCLDQKVKLKEVCKK